MADYGMLSEVVSQARSANLVADHAIGATELEVDDAGDFNASSDQDPDGGGGTLILNGATLAYTDITWGVTEDDTDLILLAEPLAVAADEGDAVTVVVGGLPAEDWYAVVDMGEGDSVQVPLTFAQRAQWPIGIYEPTPVQVSDDLEHIEDAPGRPPSSGSRVAFKVDTFTVEEPGDQTRELTYEPLPDSLHVKWIPLDVPADQVSVSGRVVTISDASGILAAGDTLMCWYAYDPAAEALPLTPDPDLGGEILAFNSAGWHWKQLVRTDATDYSAAAYDDSAWTVSPASFGDGGDMADDSGGPHVTLWQMRTRMWARRTLTGMVVGQDIQAVIRADNNLTLWLDGVQVYTGTPNGVETTATISGAFVTSSSMKLACRVIDESTSHGCFFDLELTQ